MLHSFSRKLQIAPNFRCLPKFVHYYYSSSALYCNNKEQKIMSQKIRDNGRVLSHLQRFKSLRFGCHRRENSKICPKWRFLVFRVPRVWLAMARRGKLRHGVSYGGRRYLFEPWWTRKACRGWLDRRIEPELQDR